MQTMSVIIFGPLFSTAEIQFNQQLKQALEIASNGLLSVTLPQEEVGGFINSSGQVDFENLYKQNLLNAISHQIAIAVLDGSDSDSGTCVEVGYRKGNNPSDLIFGLRTDFRSSEDGHINAMLRICDDISYLPNKSITDIANELCASIFLHLKALAYASYGQTSMNESELVDWFNEHRPHGVSMFE